MLAVHSDYKYATVYINFIQSVAYYSHTAVVLQSRYVNFILMLTIFKTMASLGYMLMASNYLLFKKAIPVKN